MNEPEWWGGNSLRLSSFAVYSGVFLLILFLKDTLVFNQFCYLICISEKKIKASELTSKFVHFKPAHIALTTLFSVPLHP